MNKFILWSLMAVVLLVSGRPAMAEYVPGEVLIKFKGSSNASAIRSLHSAIGSVKKMEFGRAGLQHVKVPADMSVEKAVEYYKRDPNVEYAEPNYIMHAAVVPDDASFGSLWGLNNTGQTNGVYDADIDAPEAWETTTGSDSIIIAVIDSGVAYDHTDFANNIWTNTGEIPDNGLDDDANGYVDDVYGWDFVENDGYPEDYNSHGTHVAGIIAAQGNNAGGITGVMWNARIMAIRFLGLTGSGTTADAISAILYAKANGARIINNSWGGTDGSQALKDAIEAFPGVVVCAAGNVRRDNDGAAPFYPASYDSPNIISVAATDHNDGLASFSNYGATTVDVAAPGVDIYSSVPVFGYGPPTILYSDNFDGASGPLPLSGWSRGGANSSWEVTGGTGVGVTNSLEDSPGGSYLNSTMSWAGYMTPIVSERNHRYTLTFDWNGNLESANDYLDINISIDAVNWEWIDYRTGSTNGSFVQYSVDLTQSADSFDQFYFGFGLSADASDAREGVYIDNVVLTKELISISGYSYENFDGTSMAAPHVSGVAGLVLANNPSLTYYQVKASILNGADPKASLIGKVLTGGRLNANNAVLNAASPKIPSALSAAVVSASQINLSWTDNADDETGFIVERRTGADGAFTEIASVGADMTVYPDSGLSQGTTYSYRVRVFGGVTGNFGYSNEVSAVTQSAPSGSGISEADRGDGGGGGGGGPCFIATAAYGSVMHPYVRVLREFRDRHLLNNMPGRAFVDFYYKYSPPAADVIRDREYLRFVTRIVLAPAVMFIAYPVTSSAIAFILFTAFLVARKLSKTVPQDK
ncbi:MAG: S8 family serine peptidase [Nitrospirae bacterium]|nr:S8 family serine peptidase [Nitrospirota bacterium]